MSTWCICLTEILEEKHLSLSDYLNQIHGPLATLSALQRFGFFWTPAAKAIRLQELAGRYRPRLSSVAQNRASTKNGSCIQILDTALPGGINFHQFGHFWAFLPSWQIKKKFSKNKKAKSRQNLILHTYTAYYNHWVLGMRVKPPNIVLFHILLSW